MGLDFLPARITAARVVKNRRFELRRSGEPVLRIEDLAKRVGVSAATVWRWENGLSTPPATRVGTLAESLGVGVQSFYEGGS